MWLTRFPIGGWTPIAAGQPLAWFDASVASTLTVVSGKVSSWASRTNGYTIDQSNATFRPLYSATGYNGNAPAVVFQGASVTDCLRATSGGLAGYIATGTENFTIAARANITSRAAQQRLLAWDNASNTAFSADATSGGVDRVDITSGGAPVDGSQTLTGANKTWVILRDTHVTTWVDDTISINNHAFGGSAPSTVFTVGDNQLIGNLGIDAALVELIVWPTRISDAHAASARQYLRNKWG